MPTTRICSRCSEPTTNKSCWCTSCTSSYHKEYRKKNPKKIKFLMQRWFSENREVHAAQRRRHRKTPSGRCVDLVSAAKKRAKRRRLPFDLSSAWILHCWQEQSGCCALTGIPFNLYEDETLRTGKWDSPSIDRIDCDAGYIKSNVRLVCYGINCCLHDFGEDIFQMVAAGFINGTPGPQPPPETNYDRLPQKQRDDKKYSRTISGLTSHLHHSAKRNAKKKKLPFSLSRNYIRALLRQQDSCALSGILFDWELRREGHANPFRPSLDRIKPKEGYVDDNVRLVSVVVNYGLNEFGDDVFRVLCSTFLTHKETS